MISRHRAGSHVCPWWFAYTFDNGVRRWLHPPARVVGSWVHEGMTVADVGCGLGHFSVGLARLVGAHGRVISIDLQQEMLNAVVRRAHRAGVGERIEPHRCRRDTLALQTPLDFALVFWMAHEVPDTERLFGELRAVLRDGARVLYAEPRGHVAPTLFERIVESAERAGLTLEDRPRVRLSRAALLKKAT